MLVGGGGGRHHRNDLFIRVSKLKENSTQKVRKLAGKGTAKLGQACF